jgi:hypothetical protein
MLAERWSPARRGTVQRTWVTTWARGAAEWCRTEGDAPERLVCRRLIMEEVRNAWVGMRESEHVLRRVRKGRGPEELGELGVECGEDVEKREQSLGIV